MLTKTTRESFFGGSWRVAGLVTPVLSSFPLRKRRP
jgi:hypothetical protein